MVMIVARIGGERCVAAEVLRQIRLDGLTFLA
jgi:hypothetical protein